jgi:hypothetical protein
MGSSEQKMAHKSAIDCLVHACITSVCAITQEYAAVQHIKKAAMRGVVVRQQAMANSPTM